MLSPNQLPCCRPSTGRVRSDARLAADPRRARAAVIAHPADRLASKGEVDRGDGLDGSGASQLEHR